MIRKIIIVVLTLGVVAAWFILGPVWGLLLLPAWIIYMIWTPPDLRSQRNTSGSRDTD